MSLWSDLRVAWQAFKTRRKMNRQFRKREDPFSYSKTPYEAARLEAMDKAVGPGPLGSALEVGCAEGHFTERLCRKAGRVIALDISAVALERARKRAPAAFQEADLLTWDPGLFAPFDAIVLGDVLYYLDRPGVSEEFAELFPRLASWLKPGGGSCSPTATPETPSSPCAATSASASSARASALSRSARSTQSAAACAACSPSSADPARNLIDSAPCGGARRSP
ncbi:MAG: class I SAM-dependent methyltransferase [Elusimicrobiota bacterium]|nr:MAG: class I SAM-dependent methyltransferase [Elusimicrobiota bacterium]